MERRRSYRQPEHPINFNSYSTLNLKKVPSYTLFLLTHYTLHTTHYTPIPRGEIAPHASKKIITFETILYFIHYIKPFKLFTFNTKNNSIIEQQVDDNKKNYNYEYRSRITKNFIL